MTTESQPDNPTVVPFDVEEHIRHVTIRQIIGAERIHDTAPLMIEGHKASSVMVVANIFGCMNNGDDILDFSLDDGTGRIKCSIRDHKSVNSTFGPFAYVRVCGIITQPRAREIKYLKATHLEKVTDPHEIFYHPLEVISHSVHLKKLDEQLRTKTEYDALAREDNHERDSEHGAMSNSESDTTIRVETARDLHRQVPVTRDYGELERDDWFSSNSGTARTISSSTTASYHTAYSRRSPSPESPPRYYQDTDSLSEIPNRNPCILPRMRHISRNHMPDPYWNLDNLQREIILCISHALQNSETLYPHSGHGVNIKVIVQGLWARFGTQVTELEVSRAIEHLLSEAYIFTTIDDQHYNLVQMYKQRSYDICMSTVIKLGRYWPSFACVKFMFILSESGDSYSSVGYHLDQRRPPNAVQPLGITYPGFTWNEENEPNWVGHLVTKYYPAPRYTPNCEENGQDPEYMSSPLLVYDYARGGDTMDGVKHQITNWFLPKGGTKPDWAPWSADTSLFITWIGINDCAYHADCSGPIKSLLELHEELYEAGSRNFLFIDVPPIERSPAGVRLGRSRKRENRYDKWNIALREAITTFAAGHEDITVLLYSSHATFTKILDEPGKYGFEAADLRKRGGSIWVDHLHPSSAVHRVVAADIAAFLGSVGGN
ncbi:hypothetical protein AX15_005202 [Amanita polypyramis BW_CC]|nr:hypothetical protein AX15_005202 [Amanita polypyramis BW_CC]